MFCIHYTPKDKPIDVKHIPCELVNAPSTKDAMNMFSAKRSNDRVLYVTKI